MEKKDNLIEDIFYGNLDPSIHGPAVGSEYRKRYDDIYVLTDAAETEENKETFRKLDDSISALEEVVARDYFILGFQWGAKMMLSILGDAPETFGYQDERQ